MASSPSHGISSFLLLESTRGGSVGILPYHSMPTLLHLGNSLHLGALGLNVFSCPWMFQVSNVFPPPTLVPLVLSNFLAEHVRGQLRLLILVAPCWMEAPRLPTVLNMLADVPQHFDSGGTMLDGGSLASHSSQHAGRCSSALSHCKRSHHGCFGRLSSQGSALSAFNPLAAERCVLCTQVFSSSL